MLEGLGYVVLAAPSPSEAIRVSEKHAGRIDLLISDVVMPKMNGRRLADRLMEMRPKIKTLFVSGYTADAIAHRGVIEDGVHFLQKPFSLRDLAIKVRQMLESAS